MTFALKNQSLQTLLYYSINPTTPQAAIEKPSPTPAGLLLEQYKLLEDRRKYFGNQFMQLLGFVATSFVILVGVLGGKPDSKYLLNLTLIIGGFAFIQLAFLARRLGDRQEDFERVMLEIETLLQKGDYPQTMNMPRGAQNGGARQAIVRFLTALGIILMIIGLVKMVIS